MWQEVKRNDIIAFSNENASMPTFTLDQSETSIFFVRALSAVVSGGIFGSENDKKLSYLGFKLEEKSKKLKKRLKTYKL